MSPKTPLEIYEDKLVVLKEINNNKEMLFGSRSLRLRSRQDKIKAWKKIHEVAISHCLIPPKKDYCHTRDVFWQNIKKTTMKRIEHNIERKRDKRKLLKYTELDHAVLEILNLDLETAEEQIKETLIEPEPPEPEPPFEETNTNVARTRRSTVVPEESQCSEEELRLRNKKLKLENELIEKEIYKAKLEIRQMENQP